MATKGLKRGILQRIFGIPATKPPANPDCWTYAKGTAVVTLSRAHELKHNGSAVRLEGNGLPLRVLVCRDDDGNLHAYHNKCGHQGRRVDPVPGEGCLQCCSVMGGFYEYDGKKRAGPGDAPLAPLKAREEDGKLLVEIP